MKLDLSFRTWLHPGLLESIERHGDFLLASGERSTVFYDVASLHEDATKSNLIVNSLAWLISLAGTPHGAVISGVPNGGLAWACMVAYLTGRQLLPVSRTFILRETARPVSHVILIEDVLNTGGSVQKVLDSLPQGIGATVVPILIRGQSFPNLLSDVRVIPLYEVEEGTT